MKSDTSIFKELCNHKIEENMYDYQSESEWLRFRLAFIP